MYNGWGSIYWDSSVGDTAAWGLYLQQVGVADQPLVDEFTTNYIVGGENLCLAPNFDNYTSEMGAISGITSPSQGSAVFNGTSDYIQLNDQLISTSHTIAAWVNANDTAETKNIFDSRDSGTDGASLYVLSTESINYRIGNGSSYNAESSGTFANEWVYAVGTYDGTTQKLYINGSLDSSQAVSISLSIGTNSTIGKASYTNSNYQNGNLANVAIWNRALSSDEINSVMWKQYQDRNTQEINGLQAWYSLDSTEVFDWYGYARNQGAVIEGRTCVDNALNALAQL